MSFRDFMYGFMQGFHNAGGTNRLSSYVARNIAGGKYYDPYDDPLFWEELEKARAIGTEQAKQEFAQKYAPYVDIGDKSATEYFFGEEPVTVWGLPLETARQVVFNLAEQGKEYGPLAQQFNEVVPDKYDIPLNLLEAISPEEKTGLAKIVQEDPLFSSMLSAAMSGNKGAQNYILNRYQQELSKELITPDMITGTGLDQKRVRSLLEQTLFPTEGIAPDKGLSDIDLLSKGFRQLKPEEAQALEEQGWDVTPLEQYPGWYAVQEALGTEPRINWGNNPVETIAARAILTMPEGKITPETEQVINNLVSAYNADTPDVLDLQPEWVINYINRMLQDTGDTGPMTEFVEGLPKVFVPTGKNIEDYAPGVNAVWPIKKTDQGTLYAVQQGDVDETNYTREYIEDLPKMIVPEDQDPVTYIQNNVDKQVTAVFPLNEETGLYAYQTGRYRYSDLGSTGTESKEKLPEGVDSVYTLPDGQKVYLIEKTGEYRLVNEDGTIGPPIVRYNPESGKLEYRAYDPNFKRPGWVTAPDYYVGYLIGNQPPTHYDKEGNKVWQLGEGDYYYIDSKVPEEKIPELSVGFDVNGMPIYVENGMYVYQGGTPVPESKLPENLRNTNPANAGPSLVSKALNFFSELGNEIKDVFTGGNMTTGGRIGGVNIPKAAEKELDPAIVNRAKGVYMMAKADFERAKENGEIPEGYKVEMPTPSELADKIANWPRDKKLNLLSRMRLTEEDLPELLEALRSLNYAGRW